MSLMFLLIACTLELGTEGVADDTAAPAPWDDADQDGYVAEDDCAPEDFEINPSAAEVCGDGIDQDCDGQGCRFDGETAVADAEVQIEGAAYGDYAGKSVAMPGDLSGDGVADLVVGAYVADEGRTDAGAAYVFFGPIDEPMTTDDADSTLAGTVEYDYLGYAMEGLRDADGDGYLDLAVSTKTMEVYVLYGPLSAGDLRPDEKFDRVTADSSFGWTLAAGADTSGDGRPELLVGQPEAEAAVGRAYLFDGDGLADGVEGALATIEGSVNYSYVGYSLSLLADMDGGGEDELAVGAPTLDDAETDVGAVVFFLGPVEGALTLDAGAWFMGTEASSYTGASQAAAGDVNGDGYGDALVGAPPLATSGGGNGKVYLVTGEYGFAAGAAVSADVTIESTSSGDYTGLGLEGVGDLDRDGYDDFLVGAPYTDGVWTGGTAALFYGPVSGTLTFADADALFTGSGGNRVGAVLAGGADINDDGSADLVFGQPAALSGYGLVSVILGDGA